MLGVADGRACRCVSQIHGVAHDTIQFVYNMLETECNRFRAAAHRSAAPNGPLDFRRLRSATDNPMVFCADIADLKVHTARRRSSARS